MDTVLPPARDLLRRSSASGDEEDKMMIDEPTNNKNIHPGNKNSFQALSQAY